MIELSRIDISAAHARVGFAGDTLNTAVYLARAGGGGDLRVEYLTVLGRDPLSDQMIVWMEQEGIGSTYIHRHATRLPGMYAIDVDDTGERSFHYWRDRSAARTLFEDTSPDRLGLAEADVVYLSGISLAVLSAAARADLISACAHAKAEGRHVVFDSNYRPRLWQSADEARDAFGKMWAATTLGLPSADDEALLFPGENPEETIERIAGYGVPEVALKRGAAGPLIWNEETLASSTLPPAPRVVDTTAAGDSFNAGYLHARLKGDDPMAAALAGHSLACKVIGHPGAILPREV